MTGLKYVTAISGWTLQKQKLSWSFQSNTLTGFNTCRGEEPGADWAEDEAQLWCRPKRPGPISPGVLEWIVPIGVMLRWAAVSGKGCELSGKSVTSGRRVSAAEADPKTAGSWHTTAASYPIKSSLEGESGQHICGSTGQVWKFREVGNACGLMIADSRRGRYSQRQHKHRKPGSWQWDLGKAPIGTKRGDVSWRRNSAPLLFLGHLTW